jgi:hypothetical protein
VSNDTQELNHGFLTLHISDYGVTSSLPHPGWSGYSTQVTQLQLTRRVYSESGENIGYPKGNPVVAHVVPTHKRWKLLIREDGSAELLHSVRLKDPCEFMENEYSRSMGGEDAPGLSWVSATHPLAKCAEPSLHCANAGFTPEKLTEYKKGLGPINLTVTSEQVAFDAKFREEHWGKK